MRQTIRHPISWRGGLRRPLRRGATLMLLLGCLACGGSVPSPPAPRGSGASPTALPAASAIDEATATAAGAATTASPVSVVPAVTKTPLPPRDTAVVPTPTTAPAPAPATSVPSPPTAGPPVPSIDRPPSPSVPAGTPEPPVISSTVALYGGTGAPYFVVYPANWRVGAVATDPPFAGLPEFVQITDPGANNFGIQIFSGPTRPDLPPATLLARFLAYRQALAPVQVTAQTGSPSPAVRPVLGAMFTTRTPRGPLTGQVDIYQNVATTYLAFSFYDTAYFGRNSPLEDAAATFEPLTPARAYPTAPPAGGPPIRLADLGSIRCPVGWKGTVDTATFALDCNNQLPGSMSNADIQVSRVNDISTDAAAASHAALLQGLPWAETRLSGDLVAFVVQSGLVGLRHEYVRAVPIGGPRRGTALLVANGAGDEVVPALLSFRAASPPTR